MKIKKERTLKRGRIITLFTAVVLFAGCFKEVSYRTDYVLKPLVQENSGDVAQLLPEGKAQAFAHAADTVFWEVASYEDALAGIITRRDNPTEKQTVPLVTAEPYQQEGIAGWLSMRIDKPSVMVVAVDTEHRIYGYTQQEIAENFPKLYVSVVFKPWKEGTEYKDGNWIFRNQFYVPPTYLDCYIAPSVQAEEDGETTEPSKLWNAWSKEECKIVFGGQYQHFWEKWCANSDKAIFGAVERFCADLSESSRELLVERAVTLYDGKSKRKNPDDSEILVCEECGSTNVEITAWVDANTNEYVSDSDDSEWCSECEAHNTLITLKEFKEQMLSWWESCESKVMEQITGLRECDYPSEEGSQAFVDAATQWWSGQDYERKRQIYKEHFLKTDNMQKDIISQIRYSCSCNDTKAQEYLDDELRHLRELQEVDDLREDDIGMACSNLGLDLDYQEYFINRLAGA